MARPASRASANCSTYLSTKACGVALAELATAGAFSDTGAGVEAGAATAGLVVGPLGALEEGFGDEASDAVNDLGEANLSSFKSVGSAASKRGLAVCLCNPDFWGVAITFLAFEPEAASKVGAPFASRACSAVGVSVGARGGTGVAV
ncbi:MAG: hypothetical protein AAFQ15_09880, partial [Pseudomonadota bacterium]